MQNTDLDNDGDVDGDDAKVAAVLRRSIQCPHFTCRGRYMQGSDVHVTGYVLLWGAGRIDTNGDGFISLQELVMLGPQVPLGFELNRSLISRTCSQILQKEKNIARLKKLVLLVFFASLVGRTVDKRCCSAAFIDGGGRCCAE